MQIYIILIVLGIWLLGASIVLYKIYKLFNRLTQGVEADLSKKGFGEINKRLASLELDGERHIQKVGLVRFNPFKELGGDHSFSLAILDGKDSGVVITGLHTRDRTRIYMKEIIMGESKHDLSSEEKKAVETAHAKK